MRIRVWVRPRGRQKHCRNLKLIFGEKNALHKFEVDKVALWNEWRNGEIHKNVTQTIFVAVCYASFTLQNLADELH